MTRKRSRSASSSRKTRLRRKSASRIAVVSGSAAPEQNGLTGSQKVAAIAGHGTCYFDAVVKSGAPAPAPPSHEQDTNRATLPAAAIDGEPSKHTLAAAAAAVETRAAIAHAKPSLRLLHLRELDAEHAWYSTSAVGSPFVISKYREPAASWRTAMLSCLSLHNDTMNIWTHLLGLIIGITVAALITYGGSRQAFQLGQTILPMSEAAITLDHPAHDTVPVWPITVYLLGFATCTAMSVLYHIFSIVSPSAFELLLKLDYAAICVLVTSSGVAASEKVFCCNPWVSSAICVVCVLCGAALFSLIVAGKLKLLSEAERVALFAAMSLANSTPHVAVLFSDLYDFAEFRRALFWVAATLGSHLFGGIVYATKVPERFAPGRFDLWHSHTIMHVAVVVSGVCYYVCLLEMHIWRLQYPDCTADVVAMELPRLILWR